MTKQSNTAKMDLDKLTELVRDCYYVDYLNNEATNELLVGASSVERALLKEWRLQDATHANNEADAIIVAAGWTPREYEQALMDRT